MENANVNYFEQQNENSCSAFEAREEREDFNEINHECPTSSIKPVLHAKQPLEVKMHSVKPCLPVINDQAKKIIEKHLIKAIRTENSTISKPSSNAESVLTEDIPAPVKRHQEKNHDVSPIIYTRPVNFAGASKMTDPLEQYPCTNYKASLDIDKVSGYSAGSQSLQPVLQSPIYAKPFLDLSTATGASDYHQETYSNNTQEISPQDSHAKKVQSPIKPPLYAKPCVAKDKIVTSKPPLYSKPNLTSKPTLYIDKKPSDNTDTGCELDSSTKQNITASDILVKLSDPIPQSPDREVSETRKLHTLSQHLYDNMKTQHETIISRKSDGVPYHAIKSIKDNSRNDIESRSAEKRNSSEAGNESCANGKDTSIDSVSGNVCQDFMASEERTKRESESSFGSSTNQDMLVDIKDQTKSNNDNSLRPVAAPRLKKQRSQIADNLETVANTTSALTTDNKADKTILPERPPKVPRPRRPPPPPLDFVKGSLLSKTPTSAKKTPPGWEANPTNAPNEYQEAGVIKNNLLCNDSLSSNSNPLNNNTVHNKIVKGNILNQPSALPARKQPDCALSAEYDTLPHHEVKMSRKAAKKHTSSNEKNTHAVDNAESSAAKVKQDAAMDGARIPMAENRLFSKLIKDRPDGFKIPFVRRRNKAHLKELKEERKSCPLPDAVSEETWPDLQETIEDKWKCKSFTGNTLKGGQNPAEVYLYSLIGLQRA